MRTIRRPVNLLALGGAVVLLAGCATASATPDPVEEPDAAVVVDNCGTEVSFATAPQRVVTIKSSTTEMLLTLGLADRIVGTAFPDGPLPDDLAADAGDLTVIAEKVPSQEAVLDLEPDLVYAGWESNFSSDGAGERDFLHSLGVNTYVSPSACKGEGYQPDPLTIEHVFGEIEEVAAIFRVPDAADALIAEQREQLQRVDEPTGELTALWYSSGSDIPFVGGGLGAPQLIMQSIGLGNIADAIDDTWASFSWEAVVDADPDVIVLVDSAWNSVEHKIEVLEGNPATANLDAVQNRRYLVVDFAASEAGVRTVPAIVELARQLKGLEFD